MFSVDNRLDGHAIISPRNKKHISLSRYDLLHYVTLLLLKKNNSFLKGKTSEWGRNSNTFTKINL